MRIGLTLIVLVLDVVAIVSILGSPASRGRRLRWVLAVVLLPLVGALGWLVKGRHPTKMAEPV